MRRFVLLAILIVAVFHSYGNNDSLVVITPYDNLTPLIVTDSDSLSRVNEDVVKYVNFKPNPTRSVWLGLLVPGLGQIYNRSYWKLPIVYGGCLGIYYALDFNGSYYKSYHTAYRDIMDSDPNTKSYEKLLPAGTDPNSQWAKDILKQRQNTYRRYRDYSIVAAVLFYALTVVEAYVDAQLYDFDISPDLSIKIEPTLIEMQDSRSVGMGMSLNF